MPEPSAPSPPDAFDLLRLFYPDAEANFRLEAVDAADVPAPYDRLLVHNNHMTVTVESFHKSLVDVRVLDVKSAGKYYARKILLEKRTGQTVVQFGVVRLNRDLLPAETFREIESQQKPLGRVLIERDVLRQVELVSLWHLFPSEELKSLFGLSAPAPTYGRSALIHVNDVPAVELLEIVAPVGRSREDP